jgi:regulator of protease activity HflC (stomatin/prohibitin superfamily)
MIGVPEELRMYIAVLSASVYLLSCIGRVPPNQEQAQLFFGSYTGESFSAGLYLLPRLPFPIFSVLLRVSEDLNQYFGWTLEGSVPIQSITVSLEVGGMTSDGIRIKVRGKLVFEITHAHTFLSQTRGDTDRESLEEAIRAECAARVKSKVIAQHTLRELQQGDHQTGSEKINVIITRVCLLEKDFGVELARSPIVDIEILSEQVQEAFDRVSAQALFARNLLNTQTTFSTFCRALLAEFPNMTETEAMVLWSQSQAFRTGIPRFNVHQFK